MEEQDTNRNPQTVQGKAFLLTWRYLPPIVLIGIILLIIALGGLIYNKYERLKQEKEAAQAKEAKPVNTVLLDLQPTTIQDAINLPGVIEPWTRLELMAKISGSITEVLVKEGSEVKQGDVLARIEEDDYRIALDSAAAAYKRAQADYKRKKVMLSKKAIPQADLELSETQMLTAKAAMDDAKLKLSRCSIIAPMDGVIRRLDAKKGLFLSIGDPIAEILELDRVKAIVGIPESDVAAVRNISTVDITIQALEDYTVQGKTFFLSPSPETTARLYRLELEVDNPDKAILPGMFFRADVVKKTVHDAVAVPLFSVITRNNEQYVFVSNDETVHKRLVQLGIIEKWMVQITDGLEAGEKVVIEGHRDVEDGQKINVLKVVNNPAGLKL